MKYSDQLSIWIKSFGYTHFFYVGGGNVMHLVESFSREFVGIPVIHEVAAGIAAEYFNATNDTIKAFALVTAGPGLTNIVTAASGAFLESRELLIIGGQAKTQDLAMGLVRQRGIQEIDGVSIMKPICKKSLLMDDVWDKQRLYDVLCETWNRRPGPVFIEVPLDIQARDVDESNCNVFNSYTSPVLDDYQINQIQTLLLESKRPLLLIGGGVKRELAQRLHQNFEEFNVPVATTWNGIDRLDSDNSCYVGRPNTWGQRSANIINQQADRVIAIGTRLGLQQTGFNWQAYCPVGKVVQIDIDEAELTKGHPNLDLAFAVDANDALKKILNLKTQDTSEWMSFCHSVRQAIPLFEENINLELDEYVSPHRLVKKISSLCTTDDVIVPCSSGGANTLMMQLFEQKLGQKVLNDKGLASMGYGLSGAIGASIANPDKRIVLVEGDGGFAQNIQEIGTAKINNCKLKIFIFDDEGYASIRMTQRSYFGGVYVGCDTSTGLGLPNWQRLFVAWDMRTIILNPSKLSSKEFEQKFNDDEPIAFIVKVNPEQTYFPKITSRMTDSGSMESNPLHLMTPDLSPEVAEKVFKYINN